MNINDVIKALKEYNGEEITLMEVCGTHTASISENAIPSIISDKIHLISGPGCPVCVTVSDYVDKLIELALDGNVIVTFGDMIRVPGSKKALKDIKFEGADIRMVYSPTETIELAKAEPNKNFVFAAVGFETTTPIYALLLDEIIKQKIQNIQLLTALKTMPNVIATLCENDNKIDGFIAPGHVAVITGSNEFVPLAEKYNLPFAVSGFEAEEILASIYALIKLRRQGKVINLYKSAVTSERNEKAFEIVHKYFEEYDAPWRGLGIIKGSGMALKKEYARYDAGSRELINDYSHQKGCLCGEIISGLKKPSECPLYGKICTPENPKGACMVSIEGTCHNYITNNRK
ncbi:hydrogenase formation protein HypD [uncultured Eubacterium sp.]|uniref:hydrogenase formation protein HypD n=1 Tax=uncultured Eubacterium sp. TaxID=165185 RepID=UPI0025D3DA9E|nr:hydrogenase formation protein HypD [uncultured Eubacterium sp.]